MCGIVAAAAQRDVAPLLIVGLKALEYRGYDSSGLAVLEGVKSSACAPRARCARWKRCISPIPFPAAPALRTRAGPRTVYRTKPTRIRMSQAASHRAQRHHRKLRQPACRAAGEWPRIHLGNRHRSDGALIEEHIAKA
jgi:hypothetical protein